MPAFDADDEVREIRVQAKDAAGRKMDDHAIGHFVHPATTGILTPMNQMDEPRSRLLLRAINGASIRHVVADPAPLLVGRDATARP